MYCSLVLPRLSEGSRSMQRSCKFRKACKLHEEVCQRRNLPVQPSALRMEEAGVWCCDTASGRHSK